MLKKILIVLFTAFLNAAYITVVEDIPSGDTGLYIYGKVYTENDQVYTGQIRWGKEEAFWFDHFNSSKPENDFIDYLSKEQKRELVDGDENHIFGGIIKWGKNNWNNHFTHQFACQFGHIKSIEIGRRDRVEVELKDGTVIHLEGGSNDIETYVQVNDEESGHIKIDWDDLTKVEFFGAPSSMTSYYGAPLYGTVQLESGEEFTGFVQWDHDERLANDKLDGDTKDGDMEIKFGNIAKIEKASRGAEITLHSGRNFRLKGSNDVNSDNRGIIVNMPGKGRVDISWDEFDNVTFSEFSGIQLSYDDFQAYSEIEGSVVTEDGDRYSGRIVYDLDETYQFELLNGENDDVEYFIPFQQISSIKPMGKKRSEVQLTDGSTIKLEKSVDVNQDNDGILVFENDNDDPVYIPWYEVNEIKING